MSYLPRFRVRDIFGGRYTAPWVEVPWNVARGRFYLEDEHGAVLHDLGEHDARMCAAMDPGRAEYAPGQLAWPS